MKTITLPMGSSDPLPELAAYLEPFAPLFRRSTSRRSLERYVTERLPDLPRKNCEAIAQAVASTSLEQLQHLLTDAAWDPLALDEARVRLLVKRSPANGVLVLDDTGLPKHGKASVGVQHQYSGTLGKQGNCQIVVSAEYVVDEPSTSQPSHWPLSARLYLPEVWAEDRERCRGARVPEAVPFASRPELSLQLIDRAQAWSVPFATIVTDAGYGIPSFLQALDKRELSYVCAVACDFGVRVLHEMQQAEAEQTMPAPRKRGQPKKPRPAPRHDAQEITSAQSEDAWQTVEWRDGSRGTLRKQFVAIRVHAGTCCARHSESQDAAGPGQRAGRMGSDPFQQRKASPSGFSVACLQTLPCLAWWNWRTCAGQSSSSMRMPKANAASITFKDVAGRACIGIWPWSRWPIPSSCFSRWAKRPRLILPQRRLFPPARQLSLPACHRQVLVLLFQDVVLWLIETEQIKAFRPRRN
jgi:SRSO17 transposase